MRPVRVYLCLLSCLFLTVVPSSSAQKVTGSYHGRKAAEGELLVKFHTISPSAMATVALTSDLSSVRPVGGVKNLYRLHSRSKKIADLLADFSARPDVAYAEPNYQWRAVAIPNDPQFVSQWALQNTGQSSDGFSAGTPGADISAVPAWDISTGNATYVVGIVDTGIDYTHPDLQANVWSAPTVFTVTLGGIAVSCPAGSHGFNAITGSCDPMDDYMHGTHVSGIIGAAGNNNVGVVGVNWTTRMIGLKFLDSQGYGYTDDAVNAIEFAVQVKASFASTNAANIRILSNSWGGPSFSQALQDEIDVAAANDILFVAAAGNNAVNIDTMPMYPASFNRPNMINVAATDNNDALAPFSDIGPNSVHLGAPGVAVLSTLPNDAYGYLSGTSMATPFVSGAAALMLSACPLATPDLKKNLLDNVDATAALAGLTVSGGRLNVSKALRSCSGPVGLSPVSAAFGNVVLGKSSPARIVTLTNYQDSLLNLSTIAITGDFAETNNCGSALAPKGSCGITVTFTPSGTGVSSGRLQVFDDASNSPQVTELSGTGIKAIDFVATTSTATKTVVPGAVVPVNSTITNNGTDDAGASMAGIYFSQSGLKDAGAIAAVTFNTPALPAGSSFSLQIPVTVPVNLPIGSYYIVTCANDNNAIPELDATNNCGATASPIQILLADLVETSVTYTGTGLTLQVTDMVTNQGSADAPASVTQYYAATFPSKDSTSRLLGGSRAIPPLPAGTASQGTVSVTIPTDLAGRYFILACADDTNLVAESNESNNCTAASTRVLVGPDLVESAVTSSTTITGAGASFTVSETAGNQGTSSAGASFTQYYLSPFTSKSNTSRLLVGSRAVQAIPAGGMSAGSASVSVPADMATGTYYLVACADDTSLIPETSETNNCAAAPSRIQVGPDLTEAAVSSSTAITGAGATFTVTDTAVNRGGGGAGASVTQYYLSTLPNKTNTSRLLNGNRTVNPLPAGGNNAGSAIVTVPSDVATGTYYLLACADDTALVPESNETNNCAASSTRVQVGPDLIESGVSSSKLITTAGGSFTVNDTAINQGGGGAGASVTQYYFGPLTTKTNSARLLIGNRAVVGLAVGASSSGSTTVAVPADMASGTYYLLACSDDTNLVSETNENNNCAAARARVQVAQ